LLEFAFSGQGLGVGEIGDRIEAADRKTGVTVDHDSLGGRGPDRASEAEPGCSQGRQDQPYSGASAGY
jgi:hypothetical protein